MRRRSTHDVFLIGDELTVAETPATRDRESGGGGEPELGEPTRGAGLPGEPPSRSVRWLAATAVPAVAAAAIWVAELSDSDTNVPTRHETSAPVALRPTARPAAVPPSPAAPPLRTDRHPRPERPSPVARPRRTHDDEERREPIAIQAPEAPPEVAPPEPSAPPPEPIPSPPPSSPGGGGSGASAEFGFER